MPQTFTARAPSLLSGPKTPTTTDHLPSPNDLSNKWIMVVSSSSLWQNQKHDVSVTYVNTIENSPTLCPLNDQTTYTTTGSLKRTTTKGLSTPSTTSQGLFGWRGAGWLRMVTTQWEIVGFGCIKSGDSPFLVVFAGKTMFSPQALSLYRTEGSMISDEDIALVKTMIKDLGDATLNGEVDKMQVIPQS